MQENMRCVSLIDKQQITMGHFEKNSWLLSMVALVASDQLCIEELIRGKLESCSVAVKCKGHTDIQGGLKRCGLSTHAGTVVCIKEHLNAMLPQLHMCKIQV